MKQRWVGRWHELWKPDRLECLVCGGLIAYGLILPITFLLAIPDPIFETDSISYIQPAFDLLYNKQFHIAPERTPGYSLFLVIFLSLFGSFRAVVFAQHLLVLGTGLLAAFICVRYLRAPRWVGIAVAFMTTSLPHTLIMGHSIMTECLYTFLVVLSVGLYLEMLHRPSPLRGLACGLAVACSLLVRPVGWALVVSLAGGWFLYKKRSDTLRSAGSALATFAVIIVSYCAYNLHANGFFGLDQFTGISVIGPTAKFVEVDRLASGPVHDILDPIYNDPVRRRLMRDEPWVRYGPDGPTQQLAAELHSSTRLNHTLVSIALQGVGAHPWLFGEDQAARWWNFLWRRSSIPFLFLHREFAILIYRGLALYDKTCDPFPKARSMTHFQAQEFARYYQQLRELQLLSPREAERYSATIVTPSAYHYDIVLWLEGPLALLTPFLQWVPLAALLLSWNLLQNQHRFVALLLLAFLNLHIILTDLGADESFRHAIPVEWIYWSLLIAGAHALSMPKRAARD